MEDPVADDVEAEVAGLDHAGVDRPDRDLVGVVRRGPAPSSARGRRSWSTSGRSGSWPAKPMPWRSCASRSSQPAAGARSTIARHAPVLGGHGLERACRRRRRAASGRACRRRRRAGRRTASRRRARRATACAVRPAHRIPRTSASTSPLPGSQSAAAGERQEQRAPRRRPGRRRRAARARRARPRSAAPARRSSRSARARGRGSRARAARRRRAAAQGRPRCEAARDDQHLAHEERRGRQPGERAERDAQRRAEPRLRARRSRARRARPRAARARAAASPRRTRAPSRPRARRCGRRRRRARAACAKPMPSAITPMCSRLE